MPAPSLRYPCPWFHGVDGPPVCGFDAAGTFLREYGRRGHGPGEFGAISGLWTRGVVGFTDLGPLAWVRRLSRRYDMEPFQLFQDTADFRTIDLVSGELGPILLRQPSERRIAGAEAPGTGRAGPVGSRRSAGAIRILVLGHPPAHRCV